MRALLRQLAALTVALLCASALHATVGESPVFTFDTRDSNSAHFAESAAFALDTRSSNSTHYNESAVFAFDTRAADGLSGLGVSGTFPFNTRSLDYFGTVRTLAGVPLAGASIKFQRYGTIFWQGTSAANGTFSPSIAAANYTVIVENAGYRTFIRNAAGAAGGTGSLDFYLAALDQPPPANEVNRVPPLSALGTTATGSQLKAYVGGSFTANATLHPDRMTIVLCHGWMSDPDEWALQMAGLIAARHILPEMPNIVVWDWEDAAAGNVFSIVGKVDVAGKEGLSLGASLQEALGVGYAQRVHFIGHSLGTIVNRYACDYVHASFPAASRDSMNSPTPWSAAQTIPHVTLLDEAELASAAGTKVVTSTLITSALAGVPQGLAAGARNWKSPIPKDAVWVDNYISAVGFQHAAAVNVVLLHAAETTPNPVAAHSYAHQWYRQSIVPSVGVPDPAVGFARTFERALFFPPTGNGMTSGSLWVEDTTTTDPLDLFLDPNPLPGKASAYLAATYTAQWGSSVKEGATVVAGALVQAGQAAAIALGTAVDNAIIRPLDATGRAVMAGYLASIETAGSIGGTVIFKSGQVITETREKAGRLIDATQDFLSNPTDHIVPDSVQLGPITIPFLRIRLTTQAAPAPAGAPSLLAANPAGQPAYAWMTVHVPANAGFLAFDFTVTGNPAEDCIVCAINDQNVFNLPAKFAPDGVPSSTDLIDVSAFAGQDIELFFGLTGATSIGCEAAIDGIRFITLPTPKVGITTAGANVAVKWPAAASGWVLESSDTLAPNSWQPVPMTGVTVESGVATVEQPVVGPKKFYRLRRTQ